MAKGQCIMSTITELCAKTSCLKIHKTNQPYAIVVTKAVKILNEHKVMTEEINDDDIFRKITIMTIFIDRYNVKISC